MVATSNRQKKTLAIQNISKQRRIQNNDIKRNLSTTLKMALGNELSCQRFKGAVIGFEDSIERGWDVNGDDDGG